MEQWIALGLGVLGFGGLVTAFYMGYRYKALADESDRLKANETARKESDANLDEITKLSDVELGDRASKWVRD